jgi:hypothetical protein
VLLSLTAAGPVVLLLLAIGWAVVRSAPSSKISPDVYARVKEGMRREEVQAALVLPPGDYRDGAHKPGGRSYTEWWEEAGGEEFGARETAGRLRWEGNRYSIEVGFDETGVVTWKELWRHVPPTPHGALEELLAWLDW